MCVKILPTFFVLNKLLCSNRKNKKTLIITSIIMIVLIYVHKFFDIPTFLRGGAWFLPPLSVGRD